MKRLVYIGLLAAISSLFSCSSTRSVYFQVLQPAQISVPKHIDTLVIINRSRPTKDGQVINVLEGIITGEGIGVDRMGGENAISTLMNTLSQSPRYKVYLANIQMKGSGTGWFPDPIPTQEVKNICKQYKADALLTLEAFDSNNMRTLSKRTKKYTKDGKEYEQVLDVATERIKVTAGWRLYDGRNVSLLDEHRMTSEMNFANEGPSAPVAIAGLPPMSTMVSNTGARTGSDYAFRISPQWISIGRSYYVRKHPKFKEAQRRVVANDWEGAAAIWKPMTSFTIDTKSGGRACYNMAVACEAQGRLEDAIEWAKKASYNFGEKRATAYINSLQYRIEQRNKLNAQMEGKQ